MDSGKAVTQNMIGRQDQGMYTRSGDRTLTTPPLAAPYT
jgi:hypothetical protein